MPNIERPGATVAYDMTGSGPPVVLGHSLFCTRSMWHGVTARLERRCTLINVELRGHGESTAEAPFTLHDLVDDWLAIMDREGVDQAALCGLSTGGMTAMRLALRAPKRVSGLALLDTNAAAESRLHRFRYGLLAMAYTRFGVLPKRTLAHSMYAPETMICRPELVERFLVQVAGFDRSQLAHAMEAVFGRVSVDVSAIRQPTLVVVGEHDVATPPACAHRLAGAIAGAELEVVPAAGHLTVEEKPDFVAALLESFLGRCFRVD